MLSVEIDNTLCCENQTHFLCFQQIYSQLEILTWNLEEVNFELDTKV